MAIKNLLVAYNGSEASGRALDAAVLMHEKYGAHVTGLLAHSSPKEAFGRQPWVPDSVRETLDSLEDTAVAGIARNFWSDAEGRIDPDGLHFISRYGRSDATVAEYARMFDLTLVGRHDAMSGAAHLELHPDRIALKSGRPVLIIPRNWQPEKIEEHAVIAWDGSRAATRALNDAMQILETKRLVTILTVGEDDERPLKGIDVETALARHGVTVRKLAVPLGRRSASGEILAQCGRLGAGLLVMGAYEHSVFREELFGGVTRHVLDHTDLPVLIAH